MHTTPLNGRQIGRLLAVMEGPRWLDKRNVAIVSLMVRASFSNLAAAQRTFDAVIKRTLFNLL